MVRGGHVYLSDDCCTHKLNAHKHRTDMAAAACATALIVLGSVIGSARVAGQAAALTTDDAGNLHVTVTDPSKRVFVNGIDILAEIDDLDEQLQQLLATTPAPSTTTTITTNSSISISTQLQQPQRNPISNNTNPISHQHSRNTLCCAM
eukprot:m.441850 g.441850  ORF g.441850 m.441850 type:complete len:149 (+) comp20283_c2_seq8:121-567(+)